MGEERLYVSDEPFGEPLQCFFIKVETLETQYYV